MLRSLVSIIEKWCTLTCTKLASKKSTLHIACTNVRYVQLANGACTVSPLPACTVCKGRNDRQSGRQIIACNTFVCLLQASTSSKRASGCLATSTIGARTQLLVDCNNDDDYDIERHYDICCTLILYRKRHSLSLILILLFRIFEKPINRIHFFCVCAAN